MTGLVLASSSPHRRELLTRLGIAFEADVPHIDESRLDGEAPEELVARLAEAKARAVAARHPEAVVIGSDQVAVAPGSNSPVILGKPENRSVAVEQLRMLSGRQVHFLTGLCVIDPRGRPQSGIEDTLVVFRRLSNSEILAYVDREQPYDCAASFRSERLGVTLVQSIRSDDPNALVGLPLIRLCAMLQRAGVNPLHSAPADVGSLPTKI